MSDRRMRSVMFVLAGVGFAIAGYLTVIHYAGIAPLCAAGHGCETVQSSRWALLAGIPVALLGLVGYVAILGSLLLRGEAARLATATLTLVGLGFSGYLTYLELVRIHAICQWCVGSAVVMTALAALAVVRLLRGPELRLAGPPDHAAIGGLDG